MNVFVEKYTLISERKSAHLNIRLIIGLGSQSKFQMSTLFSVRRIGVPWKYTNMAALYYILDSVKLCKNMSTNISRSRRALRTFARKFSNIDFFLKILPLKDDELLVSEM